MAHDGQELGLGTLACQRFVAGGAQPGFSLFPMRDIADEGDVMVGSVVPCPVHRDLDGEAAAVLGNRLGLEPALVGGGAAPFGHEVGGHLAQGGAQVFGREYLDRIGVDHRVAGVPEQPDRGLVQINDYAVEIPSDDWVEGGPIVAYLNNDEPMSVREKGPLWVVYPYDSDAAYQTEVTYSRSIWQLDRIIVKE